MGEFFPSLSHLPFPRQKEQNCQVSTIFGNFFIPPPYPKPILPSRCPHTKFYGGATGYHFENSLANLNFDVYLSFTDNSLQDAYNIMQKGADIYRAQNMHVWQGVEFPLHVMYNKCTQSFATFHKDVQNANVHPNLIYNERYKMLASIIYFHIVCNFKSIWVFVLLPDQSNDRLT